MLTGKNIRVFDCEIENDVDGVHVTWNRKDLMGFSVGVIYDYRTGDYDVYFKKDLYRMVASLNSADLIVGFNIIGFDNELIRAQGGELRPDNVLNCFDMLVESRKAIGWTPANRFPTGMKLDDHLRATFGADHMKTVDGALAPKMWRDGHHGEVTSYCIADVKREKMLFEHMVYQGWVETGAHGKRKVDVSRVHALTGPPKFGSCEVSGAKLGPDIDHDAAAAWGTESGCQIPVGLLK